MNNSNTPAMWHVQDSGLTKREYFAAMAMQGLCAENTYQDSESLAKKAVGCADALLNELEQTNDQ